MKISTSALFDRSTSSMSDLQSKIATSQAQLAQGKQIISPSDSPDKASAILRLQSQINIQNTNKNELQVTQNHFSAEATALNSTSNILADLNGLIVQANNGTLAASDRASIAQQMQSLRNEIFNLSNTQDDNGNYLFSGTRVTTPSFSQDASGKVSYMGDQTTTQIPVGNQNTVQYSRSGTDVFNRVLHSNGDGTNTSVSFFDSLDQMIQSVKSGDTKGMTQGISDINQMENSISLAVAQNGSDQSVVQSAMDISDQIKLRLQTSLSGIQDLDYTSAVTKLDQESMALQAAMSSFSKTSGLSLFNYIQG
jgi:flagellar hook-associated protein 3 FlgL